MTKEERQQKREQWKAEKEERKRRLPGFRLGNPYVWISMWDGNDYIEIAQLAKWRRRDSSDRSSPMVCEIYLANATELAHVIVALTARYNDLVDELNALAAKTKMKTADPMVPCEPE